MNTPKSLPCSADACIDATTARRLLGYDQMTGIFIWKVRVANCVQVGQIAGTINTHGYRTIRYRGRGYQAHRLAFLIVTWRWPRVHVDHRDHNRANNVWTNLRECTPAENAQNRHANRNRTSGALGVCWNKHVGKWQAQIQVHGRNRYLGVFPTIEEASAVYLSAKAKLHPFAIAA